MSRYLRTLVLGFVSSTLFASIGCTRGQTMNPLTLRKENAQLKSALRQYQDQLAQSKTRGDELDVDNEQLQTMLADEQEAHRRSQEASRMASARPPAGRAPATYDDYEDEAGADIGRTNRAAPAASASNRSSYGSAPNISGAQVLNDGNAVRIRVTNTSLFDPGKASLKPGATKVLDQVASSIRQSYPGQLIGIEGHTDADPIRKSNWKDNHELSYQRARAVYEYLSTRGGVPGNQMYIAAFGPNHPIASNTSSGGKAQNRRVEFVVRPGDGTMQ